MDHKFRGRSEAPPLYRNNDDRRPYPPNNTVQNIQNNGPENIRNQGNRQNREEDNKYTRNLNMQGARRAPPLSGSKN
jgi:hypothetical protein